MLAVIIGLIILIAIIIIFRPSNTRTEGYTGGDVTRQITFCPGNTQFYTNAKGSDNCCDGTISGHRCVGKNICTFSEGTSILPNCSAVQGEYISAAGKKLCPSTMPYYFEKSGGVKGCTSTGYLKDTYEPATSPGGKSCVIYGARVDNMLKADSCANHKLLADMKCVIKGCGKSMQEGNGMPPMASQTFRLPDEIKPRQCIAKESAVNGANYILSDPSSGAAMREQAKTMLADIDTSFDICENAERVLVHKRVA